MKQETSPTPELEPSIISDLEPSIIPTRKEYTWWTEEKAEKIVEFVKEHGRHLGHMAAIAGVSRETLRVKMNEDADFKERIELAMETRSMELEAEARRRAVQGVTRRKYDKDGNLVEEEQVYSDKLMERLLEADMPERFRPKQGGQMDGVAGGVLLIPVPVGGPLTDPSRLSQELERLSDHQRRLTEGSDPS